MPSPSFHVRHIPNVFGKSVRKRAMSYSMCTRKDISFLINKTSLLNLHDSAIDIAIESDAFGAPSSPHTSSMVTPSLFSSPIHASSSRIPNFQNENKTLYKYVNKIQKERRFGSSDIENLHKSRIKKISPKKRPRLPSFKKNYRIFSTSVTPCETPTRKSFIESHIYRLSGITMSPMTPISWSAQSPVPPEMINPKLSFTSKTTPLINDENSHIFAKPQTPDSGGKVSSAESRLSVNSSAGSSQRLQISNDSCPSNKLYFWQDDVSELITDDKLGQGGFGKVYEGSYRGQKVAIKKMQTAFRHKKAVFENFLGEVLSLRLNHSNLVRSLVLVQPPNSPLTPGSKGTSFLVMEYAGSKNLLQIINSPEVIDCYIRCKISCDILRGLDYLHGRGLAHLDLKPGNILVTDTETYKLCDFGSCKLVSSFSRDSLCDLSGVSSISEFSDISAPPSCESSRFSFNDSSGPKQESLLMGTLMYRAPELLRGCQPATSADIYSYGITAWQVWQRCDPYPSLHPHTAVFAIVAFGRRPMLPEIHESGDLHDKFDIQYSDVIKSCWSGDSSIRPTALTVLEGLEMWLEKLKK